MFINQTPFDTATPAISGPCGIHAPFHQDRAVARPQACDVLENEGTCRVITASFRKVRRYREFCRVEALVTVVFQYHPSLPPRAEQLLTSVPILPDGHPNRLRERLIKSAITLAAYMHRTDRGATLRRV